MWATSHPPVYGLIGQRNMNVYLGGSVVKGLPSALVVKNLPAMQETWVQSLGWEDCLEKGMSIFSSILAWRIPRTEGPGELQSV